jgi:ABC-type anion transport system duplicated permease subunit
MSDAVDTIADFLLVVSIVPVILFMTFYAWRSAWTTTNVGRAMMHQYFAMVLSLTVGSISVVYGEDYAARPYLRLAAFALLTAALWRMFFVLLHNQRTVPPKVQDESKVDAQH